MKPGWQTKRLAEVLQRTGTFNPLLSPCAEFEYIDVSSVSNTTFQIEETQHLKGRDAPGRARKLVKAQDVLFATIRPTLRRIAIVPARLDGQVCSTGYFVLRPRAEIDHRFLFYWLFTGDFTGQMQRLQKGASYPAVTEDDVRRQAISFPSLPEQRQIVAILDEAFEGIATAKANTEKSLHNALALFESYLEATVTDPCGRTFETKLGEVCELIGGSQPPKAVFVKSPSPDHIRLIQIRDYKTDKHVVYIPRSLARRFCSADDVMIGRYGPPVFQILRGLEGAYNVALMKAVPDESKISRDYLFYFLRHSSIRQYVIYHSARAAGQTGLTKETLEPYPIILPNLTDQKAIVQLLRHFEAETDRLTSIYQEKLDALDELKKSLLHQSFSGELLTTQLAVVAPSASIPGISTTDLHAGILAIAYQAHEKAGTQTSFGHVKAEKIAHMIEVHAGVNLDRAPIKDAAGPNDYRHLKSVESRALKAGYFNFKRDDDGRYCVIRLRGFDKLISTAREQLGDKNREVDHLISLMLRMDTRQAEIFATLYAAWNNLLIDGCKPSDDEIVWEARENWHPDKLKIPRERFLKALDWMRKEAVTPSGRARKVSKKASAKSR